MKKPEQHYHNLIIGFGKGGKTLASYLAKQGQKVALVEKSEMMYGGTCINVACIPTKSLIVNGEKKMPYSKAIELKNELTSFLRKKNFDNLDSLPLVDVITGHAAFESHDQVRVSLNSTNEEVLIHADRIFINTGTQPYIPHIPGLESSKHVFTSASLMEQSALPEKLIVIGAGFIGLEFADMYAKFGSEVTILDHKKVFLPKEDADIAKEIYNVMNAKNIKIITGISILKITDITDNSVQVQYKSKDGDILESDASAVLIATGRKSTIEGLNLDAAGIKTNSRGFIEVNDLLQTNARNVWAMGDINGGPQFTYISLDDFRIIRDQLFEGDHYSVNKRKFVASSVFITPTLSHIGFREKEAIEKGYNIKVAKLPASAIPRARILNNTSGLLKSVVDAETNKILGCTLLCVDASEMINTIQLAMNAGLTYQTLRDTIFTHPSMTEAFNDLYSSI
jgi:pyruvate/2-oxoglutarate dehydrogenase complex dihydrolipoamide dehydrogenase (E3) component